MTINSYAAARALQNKTATVFNRIWEAAEHSIDRRTYQILDRDIWDAVAFILEDVIEDAVEDAIDQCLTTL